MAVEYDLVVIGNTPEAIYAALTAATFKARVALVEQPTALAFEAIYRCTFTHRVGLDWQFSQGKPTEIDAPIFELSTQRKAKFTSLGSIKAWAEQVILAVAQENSLSVLAALGIDVIQGRGEFCRLPFQAFVVKEQKLRSRAYLLATGSRPAISNLVGLQETGYLTTTDIWKHHDLGTLPENLLILGANPVGIELAQILSRLGKSVTLVLEKQLLPLEDPEAALLLQAQLEAEGIKIILDSPILQVKRIENHKWIQAGKRAIEADEIILALGSEPNLKDLNLAGVGVELGKRGLKVNRKLQTTNPCIYGCGDTLGGYSFTHIAQYEADIAVKNALFLPLWRVSYEALPWIIFSDPQLGRVGLTPAQAKQRYGKDVVIVQQYFKSITQAQITGQTSGFCKFILRRNGEILGAHIVGAQVGELIGAIALAIKKQIKLQDLAFTHSAFTFAEIINQIVDKWQRKRFVSNENLGNYLENLFILRRNWTKK